VRFWSGWGKAFGANVQTSRRKTIGFSTMTMCPLTHHLFDNSWLRKTLQWFHTLPICLTSPPATFPYSPKMKLRLKGRHFDTTGEIHTETQEVINKLTFENFQGCMKSWETCWDCCIHAQGDYFEGGSGN
jgi:hypothetical protein